MADTELDWPLRWVDALCEVMHDAYEAEAARTGWETQETSRVPWTDLPHSNKDAMRASVRAMLGALFRAPDAEWPSPRDRTEKPRPAYRLALRPERDQDDDELMDDVVVNDVSMFRAEMMDAKTLWLCCYLPGTGVEHDRVAFNVRSTRAGLTFRMYEWPTGDVTYEDDVVTPSQADRQPPTSVAGAKGGKGLEGPADA